MDEADTADSIADIYHRAAFHQLTTQRSPCRQVASNGKCCSCHDAIEPERLAANPQAEHCVFCAEEAEALLKRQRRVGAS